VASRQPIEGGGAGDRQAAGAQSDTSLVQAAVARAKRGDAEGVHFLYVRFAADVHGVAEGLVHDRRGAERVTQGVFAGLIETIDGHEQGELPFAAWILAVARDAALDHVRAERAAPAVGPPPA
jgi:RNA polymerase sigma-70 factor (ECF subfamily)